MLIMLRMKREQTIGGTGPYMFVVSIFKFCLKKRDYGLWILLSLLVYRVMKVAKKIQDEGKKVYFAVSNNKDFSYELGEYGLGDVNKDKPIVAARDDRDRKYIMSDDFS